MAVELNGKTRAALTVAGAVAIVSLFFSAGASYNQMSTHLAAPGIHKTIEQREVLIDKRIQEIVGPQLAAINRELTRLNKNLEGI